MKPLFATLAAILLPLASMAAETQTVNATGYGTTVDEAKMVAVRSAVEAVVGTMIDAETLVENDALVENKILSYSAGLVEDVKIVGEPKRTGDGLFQVRVQAKVKKTALVERIRAETQTSEGVVDGESLYQQMVLSRQNLEDSKKIMEKAFDPDRLGFLFRAEMEENGLLIAPISGRTEVRIKAWVDMGAYEAWAASLEEKLAPMASKSFEGTACGRLQRKEGKQKDYFYLEFAPPSGRGEGFDGIPDRAQLVILENVRSFSAKGYSFDRYKKENLLAAVPKRTVAVRVRLVDARGTDIRVREKEVGRNRGRMPGTSFVAEAFDRVLVMPFFCFGRYTDGVGLLGVAAFEMASIAVDMGTLKESDVRAIDHVSVEIFLRDPPSQ